MHVKLTVLCLTMSIATSNHQNISSKAPIAAIMSIPTLLSNPADHNTCFSRQDSNSSAFTMIHHLLLIDGNHPAHLDHELILLLTTNFFNLLSHIFITPIRFTWDAFLILINTWADFTPLENTIFIFIHITAWYFRTHYLYAADVTDGWRSITEDERRPSSSDTTRAQELRR